MTIEDLRNICISLPHATEDIKYGTDLCFSIGNKISCGTRIEGPFRTGIKCNESDFGDLIPLEVKAEENLHAKSLKVYCQKYEPKIAIRTSMSDYRKEAWMTNIPLYAISTLFQLS